MRPQQQQQVRRRSVEKKPPNVRAILSTFAWIYGIIAMFFVLGPLIFVRYELMFQAGVMGFLVIIAAFLASIIMVGNELCACHGEFYVLNRHLWSIIIICFLAAGATFYYIWNTATILSMCSQFNTNTTLLLESQTLVDISVGYVAPDRGILRKHSLRLKYNTEQQCLVREQKNNPSIEALGPLKMESYRYEAARLRYLKKHREWLHTLVKAENNKKNNKEEEEEQETDELKFYMLQNEISMLLEEASLPYEQANGGFSGKSVVPLHTTTVEEDEQFQEDRAAKICRNEKGFGYFLIFLLILCEILYLITIVVFFWLKSWMPCICPSRPVHTNACVLTEYNIKAPTKEAMDAMKPFVYRAK